MPHTLPAAFALRPYSIYPLAKPPLLPFRNGTPSLRNLPEIKVVTPEFSTVQSGTVAERSGAKPWPAAPESPRSQAPSRLGAHLAAKLLLGESQVAPGFAGFWARPEPGYPKGSPPGGWEPENENPTLPPPFFLSPLWPIPCKDLGGVSIMRL